MGRIIAFLLGFAVLSWVGYRYVYSGGGSGQASAPKQRLEHVQEKADAIEQELQRRADEAAAE